MTGIGKYSFDGWSVDLRSGDLSRDGHTQRLSPQPLAMLAELLAHPGEVVSRDRMVKVLWPTGIVDFDNSLNAVVRKLRVALGEDAGAPRYFETLPRIGFRFIGTLDQGVIGMRAAAIVAIVVAVCAGIGFWWFWRTAAPTLDGGAASTYGAPSRSTNERAQELYLQARFHVSRRDIDGTELAVSSLEAALREDPHFAEGWAALARALAGAGMTLKVPVSEAYGKARPAALRALELDGQSSSAHTELAHILAHHDRDFVGADAEYAKALKIDPRNAWSWHGVALLRAYQGRVPEAFEAIRRARDLEPTMPLFSHNYGMLLYQSRRYDEAIAHAKSLLAAQPRFDQARSVLIRSLVATGDAMTALEQLPLRFSDRLSPSDAGLVYAHLARREDALAEISRLERMGEEGYGVAYDIAVIDAALGDRKAGCVALERARADHSLTLPWMRLDPRMDPLRGEPCFAEVRKRLYGE